LIVAGVDDAGRGPVIGPMVIAGISVSEKKIQELKEIGVKDSKLLSPRSRTILAGQIKGIVINCAYAIVSPSEIDEVVLKGRKLEKLNLLEAKCMARVISELKPELAYVDASDVLPERFGRTISDLIPFKVRVVSEHHADRNYPVVSAASILAKVRRDELVELLKDEYGDFGSGYVADPTTMSYLRRWLQEHGDFPPIVRKSWKTIKELFQERTQTKLGT
jgi:ribonuclease HII